MKLQLKFLWIIKVLLIIFYAQQVYSVIYLPEVHSVSTSFSRQNHDWVAVIELPTGTNRFSITTQAKRDIVEPGLLVRISDTNGFPLKSTAVTVSNGEEYIISSKDSFYVTSRFTAPNDSRRVLIRIVGDNSSEAPIEIVSRIVDRTTPSEVQGFVDDLSKDVCGATKLERDLANSVARLSISTPVGTLSYCTGFAIGPNYLITNNHCVEDFLNKVESCKSIQIEFNYTCPSNPASIVQPQCVRIIKRQSQTLDYAVIEYKLAPGDYIPPLKPAKAIIGAQRPFVLHHSAGAVMRYGVSESPIGVIGVLPELKTKISNVRADCSSKSYWIDKDFMEPTEAEINTVITHGVNTIGGASGAPVFVGDKVVGLHFDRDRRYYPKSGCFSAAVENCLVYKLRLPNWAMQICDVLADIPSSIKGINRCTQ